MPNALAPHYSRFRVHDRCLLTGHSHQAWPDCAREALLACFDDAAAHVDDKWSRALAHAARVGRGFAEWLGEGLSGGEEGAYAYGQNTHELLFRLLSALDWRRRPRIVTTTGEFHSARRQLDRLSEEGVEVERVDAHPAEDVGARLAAAVDDRTAAVVASAVFFETAERAGALADAARACERFGAVLVVDAYHALGVLPFPLIEQGLSQAYVLAGGYKYLQLGEGNCVLRIPPGCELRPAYTGWFAEFGALASARLAPHMVSYVEGGARFAGATYDPASHYRGARVFDFFAEHGLSPDWLRAVSQHQVGRLRDGFLALNLDPRVICLATEAPLGHLGGFLALRTPAAGALCDALARRGVSADARGSVLRLGPAPYLSDGQLDQGIAALAETVAAFFASAGRSV